MGLVDLFEKNEFEIRMSIFSVLLSLFINKKRLERKNRLLNVNENEGKAEIK